VRVTLEAKADTTNPENNRHWDLEASHDLRFIHLKQNDEIFVLEKQQARSLICVLQMVLISMEEGT
jgi:hypothetical protein